MGSGEAVEMAAWEGVAQPWSPEAQQGPATPSSRCRARRLGRPRRGMWAVQANG